MRRFCVLPVVFVARAACAQWQVTGTPVPELAPFDSWPEGDGFPHALPVIFRGGFDR
jgi:hypothetical protein